MGAYQPPAHLCQAHCYLWACLDMAFCRGRTVCMSRLLGAINFTGAFPFSRLLPCGFGSHTWLQHSTTVCCTKFICAPEPTLFGHPTFLIPSLIEKPKRAGRNLWSEAFSPFLHLKSCQKAGGWLKEVQIHY